MLITPTQFKFNIHWPYNCLAFKYIHLQTLQSIYLVFQWFLATQKCKTYVLCVHSLLLKCYVPLRIWLSLFQTNRQRFSISVQIVRTIQRPCYYRRILLCHPETLISERVSELTTSHHDPITSIIYYQQRKRNTNNTYSLTVLRAFCSCYGWCFLFL